MTDMLKDGMTWLNAKREAHLSTDGTYTRGETDVTVAATLVDPEYDIAEEADVVVGADAVDFIMAGDALGALGDPVRGDGFTIGGVVYEVMELGGQGVRVWSDAHQTMMRVHMKQVT